MLFNSFTFWFFLAIVLVLHAVVPRRHRNVLLLGASYLFYGFWDWRFLGLIAVSTVTDYLVALRIDGATTERRRRAFLIVSVATNLGILGFFKYYNFFVDQVQALMNAVGVPVSAAPLAIILPVGISFYTFQTMSYTIDVYRRQMRATDRFLDFALFVSFFPQLVAGPIERASRLLPQVISPRVRSADDGRYGLYQILHGLVLKVVVADNLASVANTIFATPPGELSGLEVLVGVYAFAFQIYGDFAGYSSIARGVARWLGYDLMVNFRMPYLAVSPSDFWQRWHISLSTWLRDYLYIPLGGNRGSVAVTYRNLVLTMLLGGLWHGAAWTFVAWGAFHGAILVAYRWWGRGPGRRIGAGAAAAPPWWRRLLSTVAMFHLVCIGWLFFRAADLGHVGALAARLVTDLTVTPFAVAAFALVAFFAVPLLAYEVWVERQGDVDAIVRAPWPLRGLVYAYLIFALVLFPSPTQHEFIYFQF